MKSPATAVDSVLKRNDVAKKAIELERLNMAIRDNIVTPEVKANGYGGIDSAPLRKAPSTRSRTTYKFKVKAESRTIFSTPRICRLPPTAKSTS